jgi:hypothetical protein
MKTHGVNLPTPNLTGTGSIFGNVNQTTTAFKTGYKKCGAILTYRRQQSATGATTPP